MASQGSSQLQQQNVEQIIPHEKEEVDDHEEEISNLQFLAIMQVIKGLITENNKI